MLHSLLHLLYRIGVRIQYEPGVCFYSWLNYFWSLQSEI